MSVYLIVQHASDRITHIGPAFSDKDDAERYAASLPEEWHAAVSRVELDPMVGPYYRGLSAIVDARAKATRTHDL